MKCRFTQFLWAGLGILLSTSLPAFGFAAISTVEPVIKVSGKITDQDNSPVPGINVTVKGTTTGTSTDAVGNYSLNVPDAASILVISGIGYTGQEITVGDRSVINVQLLSDTKVFGEVVVIGYGTVRRSDLTASVSSVKAEEIKAFPVASADQALSARATGINVTQASGAPGGGVTVRVRGPNSISSGSEPLYVVDGIPIISNNDAFGAGGNRVSSNALASINPNDIESIEILKDASGTAIYGSRGSNGVILITTKRGKAGTTKIDYEGSYSAQTIAKRIDVLNAGEYAQYQNLRAASRGQTNPFPNPALLGEGVNWLDETSRVGSINSHQLTLSGGSDKTQFAISGGYFKNNGIIKNTDFERFSLRLNLDSKFLNDKVRVGTSTSVASTVQNAIPTDRGGPGGAMITILGQSPVGPVYNPNGTYNFQPYDGRFDTNPLAEVQEVIDRDRGLRILSNNFVQVQILENLSFKTNLGVDLVANNRETYYSDLTRLGRERRRSLEQGNRNIVNLLNENILNYNQTFGKHRMDALVGYTYQTDNNRFLTASANQLPYALYNQNTIQDGNRTTREVGSGRSTWALYSVLSRVNYSFMDRYLVTVTFRRDGSSRFGPTNKWANFPSVAVAWKIKEEGFLSNVGAIADAKLRVSYGITGNSEIPPFRSLASLSVQNYLIGDAPQLAIFQSRVANPDLRWETTRMFNAGLDLGFLNNRLTVTADYFRNETSDLLLEVALPPSTGFTTALVNAGSLQNTGFELAVNWQALNRGKLRWDVAANFSALKNQVTSLAGTPPFYSYVGSHLGPEGSYVAVGKPLGGWFGYEYTGIWQNAAEIADNPSLSGIDKPGYPRYRNVDASNNVIDINDRTYLGDPNPRVILGLNNTVRFGKFDLNMFIRGAFGQKIRNLQASEHADGVGNYNQYRTVLYDSWRPDNPGASRPIIDATREFPSFFRRSSFFIEDGSFVRLQNLAIGFTLPTTKLVRSARVYASAQNLLMITKYTGWDPEVSNGGQSPLNRGDDYDAYPRPRTFTFGVQLGI